MKEKARFPRLIWWQVSVVVMCAFTIKSFALTAETPYQPIVERNVFALRPPTLPSVAVPENAAPPPNVELRGISTLFGRPQVLLTIKTPAKPPESPKDQSVILDVGQREGDVEVLEINPSVGAVRLRNQGKEISLTLAENAIKPTASAVPVVALPSMTGSSNPVLAPKQPSPSASSGLRLPQNNNTSSGGEGTIPSGLRTPPSLPTRSLRSGGVNNLNSPNQIQNDIRTLPREAQQALIEIERERTSEAVKAGKMPPLPPIPAR